LRRPPGTENCHTTTYGPALPLELELELAEDEALYDEL
jgi:hypothetical protein